MATPLQPVAQTGKRGFSAFDGGFPVFESADPYSSKRACGSYNGALRPSAFIDIENMAPRPAQPSAAFAGGGSCWQAQQLVMQCGGEHVQQMHLQHLAQHPAAWGCASAMECGDMHPSGGDGMDTDSAAPGGYGRYERFPPKSAVGGSPTHYHKSTAIGYVPLLPGAGAGAGADEAMVRSWECEYMGKNDYY